jgi:hypothetical protein
VEPGVAHPERAQHQPVGHLLVRLAADVGDQLTEHGVAAVAVGERAARPAAAEHRAGQRDQGRDLPGEQFRRAAGPGGMGQQFADGGFRIGEPDPTQVVVGRGVQSYRAVGDQPQHRDRRDQLGDREGRKPVPGLQGSFPVQVGPATGQHPGRPVRVTRATVATRVMAGQDQTGQALLGGGAVRYLLGGGGHVTVSAAGRGGQPGIGDLLAAWERGQHDQPVRGLRLGGRLDLEAGQPGPDLVGGRGSDGQLALEHRVLAGQHADQPIGRDLGQEMLGEVLPQFSFAGGDPAALAGGGKPGDHPADLIEGMADGLALDLLLEHGPAGPAVFAGDGQLGIVQGGELPRGQAALGLELEVTQARPIGEHAWLIGHRQSFPWCPWSA